MPVTLTDVFNSDTFKVTTLTDSLTKLPFKPSRIGAMGLFQASGIPTTTLVVEERDGQLVLIPTQPRGAPSNKLAKTKRRARSFQVVHLPLEDTVLADDVLNVRAFGSDQPMAGVNQVVNDRLMVMRQSHEVTLEYQRLGAVKGVIVDADGATEIYDLFAEFDIAAPTIDFLLDVDTTSVRQRIIALKRLMEAAMGASMYDHIHAFCGADWFDALIDHPSVYDAYERFRDGEALRNDPRKGFEFAGITFEEYPGTVSGTKFVADNKAHFFPVGVPGLFVTKFGPADFMEAVGTVGQALYAKSMLLPLDKGILLHTQSNPISLCTRPEVLYTATE